MVSGSVEGSPRAGRLVESVTGELPTSVSSLPATNPVATTAASPTTPVVDETSAFGHSTHLPSAESQWSSSDATPVIFLAFANDRDDTIGYLRNLPDEARRLRDVLQSAEQAGLCRLVVRTNCTAGDIFKVFQNPQYRDRIAIFHYGGHANGYQLLLESAAGESAAADAGGMAAFLAQQRGLQLVFLNGCSTQQQTQALLDANVSAVISTSRSIDDAVATDFSCQFYQGLAGGTTLGTAYREAEAAVQTSKGGNTRAMYIAVDDESTGPDHESTGPVVEDRWPWGLYLREGCQHAAEWNLPEAANDPLFGLPPLEEHDLPASPYRHLDRFTREDAELFFGRGRQIRELYERLTAPGTAPIMLFYGQSGVGKSSILDAGLMPRLEHDHEVRYLRRSEGGLVDTLSLAFLPEAMDLPIDAAWRAKEDALGRPLIVFLDHVEELYTRPLDAQVDELEQLLDVVKATFVDAARRPSGKLVLGFRKEWLAELESRLSDYNLPRTQVFLEPLDRAGIIEIVQGPTRVERLRNKYGLSVESGLAESIADDLLADRDSAIAPTLQILLTKMWNKATEENYERPHFSHDLYRELKRKGILLRDFLDQQIEAFRQRYPDAVDSGLLLDLVAAHTTPLGTADQLSIEELKQQYSHLQSRLPDLLQECQDLHLLTVAASARRESKKSTRLAHDTLAPLVRERFDVSDKPGQRARRILDNRSVDWIGDQEGTPLDETDLVIVEKGAGGTRAMSATELRLLDASRRLRDRLRRTRVLLKATLATGAVAISVAAGVAWWQRGQALQQRSEAVKARATADSNRGMARELMSDLVPKLAQRTSLDKEELADRSREYFDEFVQSHLTADGNPEEATAALLADAKYAVGRIHTEREQFEQAIESYGKARDWQIDDLKEASVEGDWPDTAVEAFDLTGLRITDRNEGLANDLGYTLNALGHAHRYQGNDRERKSKDPNDSWTQARLRYRDAAAIRGKLADFKPHDVEASLLYASALMNVGVVEQKLGKLDEARQQFNRADQIRRELLASETSESDRVLIMRHIAMGNQNLAIMFRQDDRAKALELVTEAIDLLEDVPSKDFEAYSDLAKNYQLLGELELEALFKETYDPINRTIGATPLSDLTIQQAAVAIDDFERAAAIYGQTLYPQRPWILEYQDRFTDLSSVLVQLYQPAVAAGDAAASKALRACCLSIYDIDRSNLDKDSMNEDYLHNYYQSSVELVNALMDSGESDLAVERIEDSLRVMQESSRQMPKDSPVIRVLDEYLASLEHVATKAFIAADHHDRARQAKADALSRWEALLADAGPEDRDFYQRQLEMTKALAPNTAVDTDTAVEADTAASADRAADVGTE